MIEAGEIRLGVGNRKIGKGYVCTTASPRIKLTRVDRLNCSPFAPEEDADSCWCQLRFHCVELAV